MSSKQAVGQLEKHKLVSQDTSLDIKEFSKELTE